MRDQFAVLTDYEVGCCVSAIEAVARLEKPLAEICERRISSDNLEALESDIRKCLERAGEQEIKGFILRLDEARVTYGFFRFQWVLEALDFTINAEMNLEPRTRACIEGFLFGYRLDAIDRHINTTLAELASTSRHHDALGTAETSRPHLGRSVLRSTTKRARYQIVDTCGRLSRSSCASERRS